MTAVTQIQGRIGEIQTMMQTLQDPSAPAAAVIGTTTTPAAAARALPSTAFVDALAAATGAAPAAATAGAPTAGRPAAGAPAATGPALVAAAMKYIGVPYVWGGENPATGLDCSGLVQRALADLGVDVPRVARNQGTLGTAVASLEKAKAGDLLIFDGGSHIGIYIGDGKMVDAPKPGRSVSVRDVFETPTAIRRVLPEASAASATTASASLSSSADLQRSALTMMSEGVAA